VRFFKVANSAFDRYTANPTPADQQWMQSHYWRMLAYSPYFDTRLSWFPDSLVYKDLYAIYVGSTLATQHPEWVLRDGGGNPLYIPFQCAGGQCPQYAGDVGSPAFRSQWISDASALLAKGYLGLFIDDVNMTLTRVSDGSGLPAAPIDPRTGVAMTQTAWRGYMADFTAAIRSAFPQAELAHNALWFIGHDDPNVQRELASADLINIEDGATDSNIQAGSGTYGFDTFLAHIDWLHSQGRGVLLDGGAGSRRGREYGLAVYFLMDAGGDAVGNAHRSDPRRWWSGYDVSLGSAVGARYVWNGLLRRDFQYGFVLVNPPGAPTVRVALGGAYRNTSGRWKTSVNLRQATGAVLWTPPPGSASMGVPDAG